MIGKYDLTPVYLFNYSARDFVFESSKFLATKFLNIEYSFCPDLDWDYTHILKPVDMPENLQIVPIHGTKLKNSSLAGRLFREAKYGFRVGKHLRKRTRGTVILCDVPMICCIVAQVLSRKHKVIIWHQDLWSIGITNILFKKNKLLKYTRKLFFLMEAVSLRQAKHVIGIDQSFMNFYHKMRLKEGRITIIENWAPSQRHVLPDEGVLPKWRLVYSGTLGEKHDLKFLVDLVLYLQQTHPDLYIQINTSIDVALILSQKVPDSDRLKISPFLMREDYEDLMSNSTFGLVILNQSAASFSVPSKIISYVSYGLCPVGFLPPQSGASSIIERAGGVVFSSDEIGMRCFSAWIEGFDYENYKNENATDNRQGIQAKILEIEKIIKGV
jgi:colanic acid biosynthesis glycosyl transferase WcaI